MFKMKSAKNHSPKTNRKKTLQFSSFDSVIVGLIGWWRWCLSSTQCLRLYEPIWTHLCTLKCVASETKIWSTEYFPCCQTEQVVGLFNYLTIYPKTISLIKNGIFLLYLLIFTPYSIFDYVFDMLGSLRVGGASVLETPRC